MLKFLFSYLKTLSNIWSNIQILFFYLKMWEMIYCDVYFRGIRDIYRNITILIFILCWDIFVFSVYRDFKRSFKVHSLSRVTWSIHNGSLKPFVWSRMIETFNHFSLKTDYFQWFEHFWFLKKQRFLTSYWSDKGYKSL